MGEVSGQLSGGSALDIESRVQNFLSGKRFFLPAIYKGAHEHGVMQAADFVFDFIQRLIGFRINNFLKTILKDIIFGGNQITLQQPVI